MLRNNYINDYIFIEMEINVIIFTDFHSVSLKKWHIKWHNRLCKVKMKE